MPSSELSADPGQRRHPAGSGETHLRRKATGGWTDFGGLQHPEGIDVAFGLATTWRCHDESKDLSEYVV